MKIRNLPYGYQYENGIITINQKETEAVKEIFNEYLGGKSLLKIAERLNAEHIEYMPGVYGWNKSRIKRLIEDKRYFDKNTVVKKMFECVSLKYKDIDSKKYISKRLKADFANASPLSAFSMDLFNRTVKAIKFSTDGEVNIILINGQKIGKEQSDDANSNNSAENSTCDSCTG